MLTELIMSHMALALYQKHNFVHICLATTIRSGVVSGALLTAHLPELDATDASYRG